MSAEYIKINSFEPLARNCTRGNTWDIEAKFFNASTNVPLIWFALRYDSDFKKINYDLHRAKSFSDEHRVIISLRNGLA